MGIGIKLIYQPESGDVKTHESATSNPRAYVVCKATEVREGTFNYEITYTASSDEDAQRFFKPVVFTDGGAISVLGFTTLSITGSDKIKDDSVVVNFLPAIRTTTPHSATDVNTHRDFVISFEAY